MLAGCSASPDLTKEQKAALQVLGESLPDPGHERYRTASETVYAREQVYVDAMNACQYGSDEYRKASAKGLSFIGATNNLSLEYFDRNKADGSEKAADWYIAEIKKTDRQIIADWGYDE